MPAKGRRRLPIGAEPQPGGGVHFRVWAPAAREVSVVIDSGSATPWVHALPPEADGYYSGLVEPAAAGMRYRYRLDGDAEYADPASRYQPEGPHGPSAIVDPVAFAWTDEGWAGVARSQVVYEMHVGTFTREGTWTAAMRELPALVELGITTIEVMPLAEFPGQFGWGYDGVLLFAPSHLYGTPDDVRQFVDSAHALGLAVILDVVYNHFGPDGCYLDKFSPQYFSDEHNEWGRVINFDGPSSGPVRELVMANGSYWVDEFHMDGLRLDATQALRDRSGSHIVSEVVAAVRRAAAGRRTWVVAENEPQQSDLVRPLSEGGCGLDALWNDDFHHTAMVALTGRREAYYTDYGGTPQEFVSAARHGFLYQGQWYRWQRKPRGTPSLGLPPAAFVAFLQNHDQVANSWAGARIHALTSPGKFRALTTLLLLGPWTPLLFQGQEFAASAPFLYFADHAGELAANVRKGRSEFLAQFESLARADGDEETPDPGDRRTFERCQLDRNEQERHGDVFAMHAALLQFRASDPTFQAQGAYGIDGAVLTPQAFVLRFFGAHGNGHPSGSRDDRLLIVNLGAQVELPSLPEPLLAPPYGYSWRVTWSSEDRLYGGGGMPEVFLPDGWRLPSECAWVLSPTEPTVDRHGSR
jgi:maltooligosyltrehalose trehalohydrolase